jgi:alpha-amylase
MKTIRFSLVLHAPADGNFDHVFREAYEVLRPFPRCGRGAPAVPSPSTTAASSSVARSNEPGYGKRLKKLAGRGQVEILGGVREPILVMLGDEDRMGQLREMSRYVEERFGATAARRVAHGERWEQSLAHDLAAAGLGYSMVDDSHFGSPVFAAMRCSDRSSRTAAGRSGCSL